LNHALGGTIKPLRLVEADTNPDLTSAFGGTADMGACCWARPQSKMTQTDWVNNIAAPKHVLSASGAQSASAPVRTGRNTFVLMDASLLNRLAVRGKMSPFGVPLVM
jgi:hypothetical protein